MAAWPRTRTVYVISVAAELAGMHPQTLRQYDRLGLVTPRPRAAAAGGGTRCGTSRPCARCSGSPRTRASTSPASSGSSSSRREVERLKRQVEYLRAFVDPGRRVFTADPRGDVVAVNRTRQPQPPPDDDGRPRRGRPLAPQLPLTPRNVRTRWALEPPRARTSRTATPQRPHSRGLEPHECGRRTSGRWTLDAADVPGEQALGATSAEWPWVDDVGCLDSAVVTIDLGIDLDRARRDTPGIDARRPPEQRRRCPAPERRDGHGRRAPAA